MKIKVEIKNVYGNALVYPACDLSKNMVKLTGNRTFNRTNLDTIKNMGYDIEVITPQFAGVA